MVIYAYAYFGGRCKPLSFYAYRDVHIFAREDRITIDQYVWKLLQLFLDTLLGNVGLALILGLFVVNASVHTDTQKQPVHISPLPPVSTPMPGPSPALTTTPTAAPTWVNQPSTANTSTYGDTTIIGMIDDVFGYHALDAVRVARCESGLHPDAFNPEAVHGSHASGLFQILYPSTWQRTSQAANSPYDAQANILAAYEIFARDGYSWREWTCQP